MINPYLDNTEDGLKAVSLTDGHKEIVPVNLTVLNPFREGKARYLYFAWPFELSNPCSFDDAVRGLGIAGVFGYFTDHRDLFKLGRHDASMRRSEFIAAQADYFELLDLVVNKVMPVVPANTPWSFGFCRCDCTGAKVPIGTSFSFEKRQ